MTVTLTQAIKENRLREFIAQEEKRHPEKPSDAAVMAAIEALARRELSEDQT